MDGILDSAYRVGHDEPRTEVARQRRRPLNVGALNHRAAGNPPVAHVSVTPLPKAAHRLTVQAEGRRDASRRYAKYRTKFCRELKTVQLPTDVVVSHEPRGIGIHKRRTRPVEWRHETVYRTAGAVEHQELGAQVGTGDQGNASRRVARIVVKGRIR